MYISYYLLMNDIVMANAESRRRHMSLFVYLPLNVGLMGDHLEDVIVFGLYRGYFLMTILNRI